VDLHAVDGQPRPRVELLVADVALEVLGLLVLDQDLLVVEVAVAVPDERDKDKIAINRICQRQKFRDDKRTTLQLEQRWLALLVIVIVILIVIISLFVTHQHHGFVCFFFFLPIIAE
jgi:hypothetical protein